MSVDRMVGMEESRRDDIANYLNQSCDFHQNKCLRILQLISHTYATNVMDEDLRS